MKAVDLVKLEKRMEKSLPKRDAGHLFTSQNARDFEAHLHPVAVHALQHLNGYLANPCSFAPWISLE